jgi:hemerythrin-like domain-containing protein
MAAPGSIPLADTSDMISLHQVFRDALTAAPQLVSSTATDDGRVELVGSYYDNVLRLLHAHHEGEDELLTPKLLERRPDDAAMVQRIADQHDAVLGAIGFAETCIAEWRADPSESNRGTTADALITLDQLLTPHLDEEEQMIVPLAATCINAAEWGQLPEHGMKTFTGDKMWLILGLVQEQMTPAQVADTQAHMPPPVLDYWQQEGQPLFLDYVGQLRTC